MKPMDVKYFNLILILTQRVPTSTHTEFPNTHIKEPIVTGALGCENHG